MTAFVPGSGCAVANPVPPGGNNPFPPGYGQTCISTDSWFTPSSASEGVDDDSPGCFTCEEAQRVKENRENMSYLIGAVSVGLGVAGAGVAGGIGALVALGLNYSATRLNREMEKAGC